MNLNPLDHKLVWNWRSCWRWASVQFTALFTMAVTALAHDNSGHRNGGAVVNDSGTNSSKVNNTTVV